MPESPIGRQRWHGSGESGALSLEAVMVLPLVALLVVGLLQVASLLTDQLLVHEAARAGARAAATTSGLGPVEAAAREAAPELDVLFVEVTPTRRRDGDVARVEVSTMRQIGPVVYDVRAGAAARVEPGVGMPRAGAR